MIDRIKSYKNRLEQLKDDNENIDKSVICKLLVMANMAEMVIWSKSKINEPEKYYFEGQAFVGRYFSDWGFDDIAERYLEISEFIKLNHW